MISEYAVEPAAIGADWATFKDLIDRFGADKGRLISRFPRKWEKKVIHAAKAAGVPDVRLASIVERLRCGSYKIADFCRDFDHERDWIGNALREHEARPFHAIVCSSDAQGCAAALSPDDCADAEPRFSAPVSQDIVRAPEDIAGVLTALAAAAQEIDLVDPYFDLRATNGDYLAPLTELLARLAAMPVAPKTIRIHFRTHPTRPTPELLARDGERLTRGMIPDGYILELCEWQEIPNGEDFHDRFFLTDIGGLMVGAGFSATGVAETATFSLLDYAHAQQLRGRFLVGAAVYAKIGSTVRIHSDGSTEVLE
jgi:hypothetical protein